MNAAEPLSPGLSGPDSRALDDCLKGIARGDEQALARLYQIASPAIYSYALSLVKNPWDAEDVLHDCCIRIYSGASSYRPAGKPMAWILTITRNLCLQHLRARNRCIPMAEEDWDRFLEEKKLPDPEDRLLLSAAMKILTDQEREIVVLRAVAGLKHREIAAHMGLLLSTVLSKYRRAIQKLQCELEKEALP